MIWAEYRKFVRTFGAGIDVKAYVRLFTQWEAGAKVKMPKAMLAGFEDADEPELRALQAVVDRQRLTQTTATETELFTQRKRLNDAERVLAGPKPTRKAADDQRIAGNKIAAALLRLEDLRRSELKERDSRIFPGVYAPVMVVENGQLVVKPMRYQCRPAGRPAFYDTKFPGTYNARRDNLRGFWKEQFGRTHGIMVVNAFYENVSRHAAEHRELAAGEAPSNVVLEFRPRPTHDMLVACLWSRWTGPDGEELLSCAAITDEPPAEVAAAGHDRCIVPVKPENMDAWLTPQGRSLDELDAILEDKDRPYYEHRLAA